MLLRLSRSVPDSPQSLCISDAINCATRTSHDRLNKLVTAYLPRALPPYVDSPALYTAGIADFGLIYETFENCWAAILDDDLNGLGDAAPLPQIRTKDARVRNYLRYLHSPDLARGARIRHDVSNIQKQHPQLLASLGANPRHRTSLMLERYLRHIETAIRQKPHVLIAYSWIMYMALFSGGRWIRKQLQQGGSQFWSQSIAAIFPEVAVAEQFLSVLHFDGFADGEDIKKDFKQRLREIDVLLTPQERADIVKEAVYIFESTASLVEDLHRRYGEVSELTLSQRYSILFTHESHYSAQFWVGFIQDPVILWSWAKRVLVNLLLDTKVIDLDYLAKREIEQAERESTARRQSTVSLKMQNECEISPKSRDASSLWPLLTSVFIALDVFILVAWIWSHYVASSSTQGHHILSNQSGMASN